MGDLATNSDSILTLSLDIVSLIFCLLHTEIISVMFPLDII